MSGYKTFTVIPTVQATPDYADGDVLFSPTEIPDFFPSKNSSAQIVSLLVIDKVAANTSDFTLYFTPIATSFGTVNASADGIGSVVSSYNWARNSFSTSLYIVGIADEAINCASTSDLIIKIGVKYL